MDPCRPREGVGTNSNKMRLITAHYNSSTSFKVPNDVPLLPASENAFGKPWSWYVMWDTLHYFDDKGEEHEIEPASEYEDLEEKKRPERITEEDVDTDEE
jgi:hypothetical protein